MTYSEFGPSDEIEALLDRELGPVIGEFEITSVPEGGAPDEIRADWVGARLPLRTSGIEECSHVLFDDLTQSYKENFERVAIHGLDAVVALRRLGRDRAADWWIESGFFLASLVFRAREGVLKIHNGNIDKEEEA